MVRRGRAKDDAGRTRARRAARRKAEAAAPPASSDGESSSSDVRPVPPPGVGSASAGDPGGGKGAGKTNGTRPKACPVACHNCNEEGKRFKMESVWDVDEREPEGGRWLHTCANCIMDREHLSSVEAAQAWIINTAQVVASALPRCVCRVA